MISAINQQFIEAAQNNRLSELKNLLSQGADIHTHDDEALKESAKKGYLETVKFLLIKGANIHADDDYALKWAAEKGYIEIVKFLLVPAVVSVAQKQLILAINFIKYFHGTQ